MANPLPLNYYGVTWCKHIFTVIEEPQIPHRFGGFSSDRILPSPFKNGKVLRTDGYNATRGHSEEIALVLHISTSTVNKHLDSVSGLLNANNRTHAIAKAVDGKLTDLEYKKKAIIFYI